jgi:Peptidase family M23
MPQILIDAYNPGGPFFLRSSAGLRTHPLTGAMIGHQGIDWSRVPGSASIAGAPIPVAADGVVVDRGFQLAADGTGWGNYVVVEHTRVDGTTFQTLYAHLQSPASLQPGAHVVAGQSIGGVGATGGASGPHIHMEVIVNGNARPATMGGTRGLRLNPATFTEWGELPHMIGTDANGNQIIAQDSGDRFAGTWTSTLTYRSPAGEHVRTVSLSTSPIDDGAGNTIGFAHSYSDSAGNPQTIVSNASGVVISRTMFGSAVTTVEQNGLTITTDAAMSHSLLNGPG